MKYFQIMSILLIFLLMAGCSNNEPTKNDIQGVWVSETGGEFEFYYNGKFEIKNLLGVIVFNNSDEYKNYSF